MPHLKIYILLLFCFCKTTITFAQQKKIDSLQKILINYKKEDTVKAEMIHQLGMLMIYSNPKKTLAYSKELSILGNKLNHFDSKHGSMEMEAAYYFVSAIF